jgi:hypothetical protein
MDRQGIRTLFDRETKRLKQFELSGPRRERISLETYPDELAARDAEFRQEARYGKWSEPGPQSHGLRCKRQASKAYVSPARLKPPARNSANQAR